MSYTNHIRVLREARGLTQTRLAEMMGAGVSQVSRWERGDINIPMSRLAEIARALQCDVGQLFDSATAPTEHARPNAMVVPMEGASMERMREDLPIFGTALGAPKMIEGEAIEQTMLNTGDVVHYAKRPVILNGNAEAYGLYVQGQSMEPVHIEGDFIVAERKRPARIGDDVVVYLRPKGDGDDGLRARGVLVKRLVRRTGSYYELAQFNPAATFTIPSEDVVRVDRVLRLADLIG